MKAKTKCAKRQPSAHELASIALECADSVLELDALFSRIWDDKTERGAWGERLWALVEQYERRSSIKNEDMRRHDAELRAVFAVGVMIGRVSAAVVPFRRRQGAARPRRHA